MRKVCNKSSERHMDVSLLRKHGHKMYERWQAGKDLWYCGWLMTKKCSELTVQA